jgi:hypothetical protein
MYYVNPRNENHEIFAGWDQPLNTYFAHVIDKTKIEYCDDGRDLLWIGCVLNEIQDVQQIVTALRPYMDYDEDELIRTLQRDAKA